MQIRHRFGRRAAGSAVSNGSDHGKIWIGLYLSYMPLARNLLKRGGQGAAKVETHAAFYQLHCQLDQLDAYGQSCICLVCNFANDSGLPEVTKFEPK